jgi:hypothetical protein
VIPRNDEHVFHVIDGSSVLNGTLTLSLIDLIVREILRRDADPWVWSLIARPSFG